MCSPLALVLVNILMGFHKSKWLNEYNISKPKFCLRYVDDILAAFENKQDSLNFLNSLNNKDPTLSSLQKNKLTIPSVFLMHSFQVPIIKISHFKHITN